MVRGMRNFLRASIFLLASLLLFYSVSGVAQLQIPIQRVAITTTMPTPRYITCRGGCTCMTEALAADRYGSYQKCATALCGEETMLGIAGGTIPRYCIKQAEARPTTTTTILELAPITTTSIDLKIVVPAPATTSTLASEDILTIEAEDELEITKDKAILGLLAADCEDVCPDIPGAGDCTSMQCEGPTYADPFVNEGGTLTCGYEDEENSPAIQMGGDCIQVDINTVLCHPDPRKTTIYDLCNGSQVIDTYCSGGAAQTQTFDCQYGCSSGMCVCRDTDQGKNKYYAGSIVGDPSLVDTCATDTLLKEYYTVIEDGKCKPIWELIDCGATCANGRCLLPSCKDGVQNGDETGVDCGGSCIPCDVCAAVLNGNAPATFDWRNWQGNNWISPIRNQAACGSCWSFSAVGTAEARYNIEQNNVLTVDMSEQFAVSNGLPGDCHGGFPATVLDYMKNNKLPDEACFPYQSGSCLSTDPKTNKSGWCVPDCQHAMGCSKPEFSSKCTYGTSWKIQSYLPYFPLTIDLVKMLVACKGPVSVASENWDHAVVIVGWEAAGGPCMANYGVNGCWIIKNSHGVYTGFGNFKKGSVYHEDGFAYVPYSGHAFSDVINQVIDIQGVYPVNN